jgi:DtxR family transcriptional regulator, Mn-dependent transcriptional regulator
MTRVSSPLNSSFQQYCETIFELEEDEVEVIQARIAERLGVSRPAVSEMVRKLEAESLVSVDGTISLTSRGLQLAQSAVRRHRLAERMLTDILGLSWADAHEEASRWERVISPTVERAINRLLGEPTTCPHGNPIPGSDYEVDPAATALAEVEVEQSFEVVRVPETLEFAPGVLEFLESAGLKPGRTGWVTTRSPDGTVTVDVEGNRVGVGPFAAARILVVCP